MKKTILFGSNKKIIIEQTKDRQIFKKQDIHTPYYNNLKQKVIEQNLILQDEQDLIQYNDQLKQQFVLNDQQIQQVEKSYSKKHKKKDLKK